MHHHEDQFTTMLVSIITILILYLRNRGLPGSGAHAFNPSTRMAEAGGSRDEVSCPGRPRV